MIKDRYRKTRWDFFWKNFQLPEVKLEQIIGDSIVTKPVIFDELCLPPYYVSSDHDDTIPLFSIIRNYKPHYVLELGTAYGATVANICQLTNARIYTVNALPEQMEGHLTTYALTKDEIGYVYRKFGYKDRVVQIYENTKNLILERYLHSPIIDIAIIDACHDTDFVINDFFKILPFMNQNSIIFFHDVHPSLKDQLRDSYIACMYLRKLGFNIKYIEGTWWGVWFKECGRKTLKPSLVNLIESIIRLIKGRDYSLDALFYRNLSKQFIPDGYRNSL